MFNGAQAARDDNKAFQAAYREKLDGGLTIRDFFAGQYMAAAMERAGSCKEYELRAMFGDRGGVRREEIAAKLAYQFADAMLEAR